VTQAAERGRRFTTTDYILDETATLLKARGLGHLVEPCFEIVFRSAACRVEWIDADRFAETRRFFLKHADQQWSFTDCFSFHVMRHLGIQDALTTDRHFRQAVSILCYSNRRTRARSERRPLAITPRAA
jgi:uncharacterized protein